MTNLMNVTSNCALARDLRGEKAKRHRRQDPIPKSKQQALSSLDPADKQKGTLGLGVKNAFLGQATDAETNVEATIVRVEPNAESRAAEHGGAAP